MECYEMNKMTYNNRHENAYCISLSVHKYYVQAEKYDMVKMKCGLNVLSRCYDARTV